MFIMKLKQSKSFFNFLLDKNSTEKQIYFLFIHPSQVHLESIIELIHNLLENKSIKISPLLKGNIKKHRKILVKFTSSVKKSLLMQKKILKKYFRLFYVIIYQSRNIISLALAQ